jgi:hypothetical protein
LFESSSRLAADGDKDGLRRGLRLVVRHTVVAFIIVAFRFGDVETGIRSRQPSSDVAEFSQIANNAGRLPRVFQ